MSAVHTFAGQVSVSAYLTAFFYIFACIGVMLATLGVLLLDIGAVNPKHLVDMITQRFISILIGGGAFLLVGYGVWQAQYYQAFAIPHPFTQAIADWWLGGNDMRTFAQHLDPAAVPNADMQQIFLIFFVLFSGIAASFIHGAGLERLKPLPCFIMAALVGAFFMPVLCYFTYGSTSPLTNAGLHDFVGDYSLYIFVGTWALVMAWKIGPRKNVPSHVPYSFGMFGLGAFLLMIGIPMLVVGCGFLTPGAGYYGVTMTESGLGITFVNVFTAFTGGAISGAILAYGMRKPVYALLSPIAGYVSCSPMFDIAMPWQAFIVALIAPFVMVGFAKLIAKAGIDEPKIAPLALAPGVLGALATGIIGQGDPAGGYFGLTSGPYTYLHAHISFELQLFAVVLTVAFTAVSSYVVLTVLDLLFGLRISEEDELIGMDKAYWLHDDGSSSGDQSSLLPGAVAFAQTSGSD